MVTKNIAVIQFVYVKPLHLIYDLYMCKCHLIDIGVLLAELSFVLHNGLQVRETISNLQRRRVKQIVTTIWKPKWEQ